MASLTGLPFAMFPPHHDSVDEFGHAVYTSGPMDVSIPADAYGFHHQQQLNNGQEVFTTSMGFEPALYAEAAPNYMLNNRSSPGMYDESDMRLPSSSRSTASAPSAASSAIGSPQSNHGQMGAVPDCAPQSLGVQPSIVGNDYIAGSDYPSFAPHGMEELAFDFGPAKGFVGELDASTSTFNSTFTSASALPVARDGLAVDYHLSFSSPSGSSSSSTLPANIGPPTPTSTTFCPKRRPSPSTISTTETFRWPSQRARHSVTPSPNRRAAASSPQPNMMRTNSSSPFLHNGPFQPTCPSSPHGAPMENRVRAPSMSHFVQATPGDYPIPDDTKEKQRCSWPDCGKVFKDLKAHMLTHQNERPEKCPIQTCEYHVKGFARKYDKNRHTLTHYNGTMVCGFCPGSGSAAENSFNRADVFRRHLTSVHSVEQTPPNSRKKSAAGANSNKKLTGYAPDATGKCSTCSQTFSNAQDFYEHLGDCVLRIVQQEDPAEAINAKRLAEVENDRDVHQTLEKNNLPTVTETTSTEDEDEDIDTGDEDDVDDSSKSSHSPMTKKKGNPPNGVQMTRGVTHSRGGVTLTTKRKGRKNRRDYPSSWGFDKGQMTMKKRVMAVFDGPRRLAKDDMMLSTGHEVRIKLSDGKAYVTDLDVQTLKRAEGFLGATYEEKGPWISDDPTVEQLKEMQMMMDNTATI
ncbi:hypothetical protein EDB81DRAFT_237303 [Dactylonectria macrodidyma]|uniref:C2H2-type domain-containing protein n=1 Tax=Dactylonectria macrodidyma TaxID=307937 RepID=A0A9P9DHY3_9HYPO|nr:hypothetical protein EDB81DRAFT_237303 [Dactylonectria macrodidyma]